MTKEMLPGTPAIWADCNPFKTPPIVNARFKDSPKKDQRKESSPKEEAEKKSTMNCLPHIGGNLDITV